MRVYLARNGYICKMGIGEDHGLADMRASDSKLEMAARLVNSTESHLFLTGKAGTGKTTFLRRLAAATHKSHIIVAPTGIAALNAEGVTIHSQFLFPFGSFLPEQEPASGISEKAQFYTKHTLTRVHTLNSHRKMVLRATELIIIDEVSMLRADILDAIDFRMRSAKGNYSRSFGGAQLLMIGDLYQLPPIVKDEEWEQLQRYYKSMHFFEALAFREGKMVTIELDRIFRQHDDRFIRILNHLRDNRATTEDIAMLNSHFRPQDQSGSEEETITITTHNYRADNINKGRLGEIPVPSSFFRAEISGEFPEKLYPLPKELELKPGAQVMFVRNDSGEDRRYVNGTLARVDRIVEDELVVVMRESGQDYKLQKEVWENKRYIVNEESKEVEEEVVGTFGQYPVKLAWAVTVHKSQGLTFDKAVIDVGQAFAPGQVYVALSRLRSLDGLILRTRINPSSIMNDRDVLAFSGQVQQQESLDLLLEEKQKHYLEQILTTTFDFSGLIKQLENLQSFKAKKMEFEDEAMQGAMGKLLDRFEAERAHTSTFRKQLHRLLRQGDREVLLDRIARGSAYYTAFMDENLKQLLFHVAEVERLTRTKTYLNALSEIEQQIMMAMAQLERAEYMANSILCGREIEKSEVEKSVHIKRRRALWEMAEKAAEENPKFRSTKSGRKRKKGAKVEKGETYRTTYALVKEGRSIREIATKRKLATSTIEGHLAKGISKGDIDIFSVMEEKRVNEIAGLLKRSKESLGEIHKSQNGKYSHGELRMVHAHQEKNDN